ncbi:MAG: tRNA (adenosine(37)-N6)-dimethylallyltransferase MiaA [Opitutaceae bacterium]
MDIDQARDDAPVIHVLTGATAVGKTELSLAWAEAHQAEIVSCDPLLFYRGMDIGTAKPTLRERSRVPHHLIDIAEVDQPLDIRSFVERAEAVVEDILGRGKPVLVCGATGFYLQAFYRPVVDAVEVPDEIRAEVGRRLQRDGLPSLVRELQALNPAGLGGLDLKNPRRVTRALERCLVSGRDLLSLRSAMKARSNSLIRARKRTVRLVRDRDALDRRIRKRISAMLEAGLVGEVEGLLKRGLAKNPSGVRAVGYRETIAWLAHPGPLDDLAEAIAGSTRRLVRKQLSWYRTQLAPHRVVELQEAGEFDVSSLFEPDSAGGGSMAIP